jgi:hypothetical protein
MTDCLRQAGSGTKAALDETVMKDAGETPSGLASSRLNHAHTSAAGHVHFGTSTQDIRDCVVGRDDDGDGVAEPTDGNGVLDPGEDLDNDGVIDPGEDVNGNGILDGERPAHPLAIGYLDADASLPNGAYAPFTGVPGAYPVKLNGLHANDTTLPDRKLNIKCGKYYYWTGERLNYRTADMSDISVDQDALISDFVASASTPATIALLPAADFWVAPADMFVTKVLDAGPVLWKAGAHPTCKD